MLPGARSCGAAAAGRWWGDVGGLTWDAAGEDERGGASANDRCQSHNVG